MTPKDYAIKYHNEGHHVIPIREKDIYIDGEKTFEVKRPYVKWKQYQQDKPLIDEIDEWWASWPEANIGLVTGKKTNLVVIDVDDADGIKLMQLHAKGLKPVTKSPHGYHFWFDYHPHLTNTSRVLPGIDIRTDGGYIITSPGKNGSGGTYQQYKGGQKYSTLPDSLYSILKNTSSLSLSRISNIEELECKNNANALTTTPPPDNNRQQPTTTDNILFKEGSRDETLFHLANHLVKGGMPAVNIEKYLIFFAQHCVPPFPKKEISIKIQSALDRQKNQDRNLTQDIRDYIMTTFGNFSTTDVYQVTTLTTREDKKKAIVVLGRLVKVGIIERVGNQNGVFRRIIDDAPTIDLFSEDTEPLQLKYPLGLHDYFQTMEKNLIVIAGTQDSGKTAFCMNFSIMNRDCGIPLRYMSSEMGSMEMKTRTRLYQDVDYQEWGKIEFRERSSNFQDLILPDGINIIDYLEISDSFYQIAGTMKEIFDRLKTGIALIALQKDFKAEVGRGGSFGLEKPRLYITLTSNPPEGGIAKIVKCKNWMRPDLNPNGKVCHFKIRYGSEIRRVTDWLQPKPKEIK